MTIEKVNQRISIVYYTRLNATGVYCTCNKSYLYLQHVNFVLVVHFGNFPEGLIVPNYAEPKVQQVH